MRISDVLMSTNFLQNLNSIKEKTTTLQEQIATQSKINSPSDSPIGTSNLLSWNSQLNQTKTYSANIDNGLTFLQNTSNTMQSIQDQIVTVLTTLSTANNTTNTPNLGALSDQVDGILNSIINLANSKSDGKYLFGGTDFSSSPFSLSSDGSVVQTVPGDISGAQNIRTSQNTTQQINMPGADIFGTLVRLDGNIDSTTAIGGALNQSTTVYDATGNPYTLNTTLTKTAANTYNMTYDVVDGGGTSIFSSAPAAKTVVFNPTSGNINTVDGAKVSDIHIKDSSKNIDFSLNIAGISENSSTSSLTYSANQQTDIFNTLIQIKNTLAAGKMPLDSQTQAVTDFNLRLLDNISKAGNLTNDLTNSKDLLSNKQTQLTGMISNEQGIDVAQAITDLQNQNTMLQYIYKIAATTVQDSLLNYL